MAVSRRSADLGKVSAVVFVFACGLLASEGSRAASQAAVGGNERPVLLWKVPTPEHSDYVLTIAIGQDGLIYAGTWAGTSVQGFAPDGILQRELGVGRGTRGLAVGQDGSIFAGTDNYTVMVFDRDGKRKAAFSPWKISTGAGLVGAVAAADDGVLYMSAAYQLYAIDPNGAIRWQSDMNGDVTALARGDNGLLFVASSESVCTVRSDGAVKSRFAVGPTGTSGGRDIVALAVGHGDTFYAGTRDHFVYAISAIDGALKWTFKPVGTPFAIAEGLDGAIYVGSYDGNIYALDPASGRVRWRFSAGSGPWGTNAVHALAVGKTGVLYAGVGNSVEAIGLTRPIRTPRSLAVDRTPQAP